MMLVKSKLDRLKEMITKMMLSINQFVQKMHLDTNRGRAKEAGEGPSEFKLLMGNINITCVVELTARNVVDLSNEILSASQTKSLLCDF